MKISKSELLKTSNYSDIAAKAECHVDTVNNIASTLKADGNYSHKNLINTLIEEIERW